MWSVCIFRQNKITNVQTQNEMHENLLTMKIDFKETQEHIVAREMKLQELDTN